MKMTDLYQTLSDKIKQVDLDKIYKGFKSYPFALYDAKTIYLENETIPWNEAFIGNTAITYEGKTMAIWDLRYQIEDTDIFASKLIHEMFHVHQLKNSESRFPNELKGLDYKYDELGMSLKILETICLQKSIQKNEKEEFNRFLAYRRHRESLYPENLDYESKIEVVEGTARYVELLALKQFDQKKYSDELERILSGLSIHPDYIPVRIASYNIGACILIACDKYGIPIENQIFGNNTTYSEKLLKNIKPEEPALSPNAIDLSFVEEYNRRIEANIAKILEAKCQKTIGEQITGLDPMNTYKIGIRLYCKNFIRIRKEERDLFIFGESVVEQLPCSVIVYQKETP